MTDAELIRAIQAGDAAAVEALYRRYLPSVWRYACARLGGDVHAAEDVTSETFLAAVRGIRGIDADRGPVAAWLMGIARHKLGDHNRRARRSAATATNADRRGAGKSEDPSASAETAERAAAVVRAMEKMPDDERIVLEWKYLDGLSVRDIAARLGRTEKAAETLLYRARRCFRGLFRGLQGPGG